MLIACDNTPNNNDSGNNGDNTQTDNNGGNNSGNQNTGNGGEENKEPITEGPIIPWPLD